jgi:hypothetical protein
VREAFLAGRTWLTNTSLQTRFSAAIFIPDGEGAMLRVQDPPRTSMSEPAPVRDVNARMESFVTKWLARPAVRAIVHRRDADPKGIRQIAL